MLGTWCPGGALAGTIGGVWLTEVRVGASASVSSGTIAFFIRAMDGGGAQRDMILLANAVAARGRSVEILTLIPEGPLRALVSRDVTLVEVAGGQLRTAWAGLRRALARRRPLAIVSAEAASNLLTLAATWSLPRDSRPRVVLREVSSPSVSQRLDPYRQTRWAYGALRRLYRHADAVVALTEGARRDLAENFSVPPRKLVLMTSNAVIEEQQAGTRIDDEARVPGLVVAVGRLSPEKDQATLIRAFAALPRDTQARLEIYGTGPLQPELDRLVADLGLRDRVSLMGFVLDPFPVFRRAALLVSASRYEGFGNVIVEALSCGTPVVSTDCPYGPAEILENGLYGRLVPVGDARAIATAITEVLAIAPDRARLRARAGIHTVGRAAEVLDSIIEGVLSSRAA